MNFLDQILTANWVARLGWTLFHSLWEIALVTAVLALLLSLLRRGSANMRYLVACIGLTVMAALPIVTFSVLHESQTPDIAASATSEETTPKHLATAAAEGITAVEMGMESTAVPVSGHLGEQTSVASSTANVVVPAASQPIAESGESSLQQIAAVLSPWMPWCVVAWFVGVFFVFLWNLGGWIVALRLKRLGTNPVADAISIRLSTLAERSGINRSVTIMKSLMVEVPVVVGWLRPMILLPVRILTTLTPAELDAILAHELAHIRRHDYLVNLLQTVIETLFFYHPGVWWLSRQIRAEREHCCDDMAVAVCGNKVDYASALAALEAGRAAPKMVMAACNADGSTLGRIRRILGLAGNAPSRWGRSLAGGLITSVMIVALVTCFVVAGEQTEESASKMESEEVVDVTEDESTQGEAVGDLQVSIRITELIEAFAGHQVGRVRHRTMITVDTDETRELVEIGRPAVSTLVKALKDPNKHIRRHAAFVLGKIGDADAVEPLLECCRAEKSQNAKSGQWDNDVLEPASQAAAKLLFPERAHDHNWIYQKARSIDVITGGNDEKAAWGKPVDGVQSRIKPVKLVWAEGQTPKLEAFVRRTGKVDLLLSTVQTHNSRLIVDGRPYRHQGEGFTGVAYHPSSVWQKSPRYLIALDDRWLSIDDGTPLAFTPGKHTIQYGWPGRYPLSGTQGQGSRPDESKPILLMSNSVEIVTKAGNQEAQNKNATWGEVVSGLQAGIRHEKKSHQVRVGETAPLICVVRNVSDKPIRFTTWEPSPWRLDIRDLAGWPGGVLEERQSRPVQIVTRTLQPGATHQWTLLRTTVFSPGAPIYHANYGPDRRLPFVPAGPGKYTVSCELRVSKRAGDDWEGTLSTGKIPLEVLPPDREQFSRRVASALKRRADRFNLKLVCMGDEDDPFRSLRLITYQPKHEYPPSWISVSIDLKQMNAIVDHLAEAGYLYDAFTRPRVPNGFQAPCYFLSVGFGRESEPSRYIDMRLIGLGWDLETLRRLQGLRDVLKGDASEGIDKLLAALEPQRKLWEAADAEGATSGTSESPAGAGSRTTSSMSAGRSTGAR